MSAGLAVPRRCPLCGGSARDVALRHPDGVLARCRGCGLVSVDPLPASDLALRQYDEAYFRGEGYRDYVAEERAFRGVFRRRLARLRAFGARGSLLDVGAATGAFLAEAAAAGFVAAGVEPSAWAAEVARGRGFDVVTGPVEALDATRGPFDVVTSFDVVEHLVDPLAGVRTLVRHARPGGLVAVTVPDFGGWWARWSGARWPFVTPKEHLHYFTRRTLRVLFEAAGLRVREVSLATTPLSLGTALSKGLGAAGAAAARALGRLADRGGALPFGTLLAIGQRPPA
ncbi:MAG: class I SAM-dependent methyltransferase [Planctomycetota bacterium]